MDRRSRLVATLFGRVWFAAALASGFSTLVTIAKHIDDIASFSTILELAYEFAIYLASSLIFATVAAVVFTAAGLPFLYRAEKPQRVLRVISIVAYLAALVVSAFFLLKTMLLWLHIVTGWPEVPGWARIVGSLVLAAAFALAFFRPPLRRPIIRKSLRTFGSRGTRRAVIAGGAASLGLAVMSYDPTRRFFSRASPAGRSNRTNVLLLTFDALAMDETSLHDARWPSTPNIAAFARSALDFTNAISASTFTTPGVASFLTGRFPSEHRLYDLSARLHGADVERNLPHLLRDAGYVTAASVANPHAHPDSSLGIQQDFDFLPPPALVVRTISRPWRQLLSLRGLDEAQDEIESVAHLLAVDLPAKVRDLIPNVPARSWSNSPPELAFQQGMELLARCRATRKPFFLWIHTFTPHHPYLPEPPFRGRFLKGGEDPPSPETVMIVPEYRYPPDQQKVVDRMRLKYCEWLAQSDFAFANFMKAAAPMLENTAVIVSTDHGESFDGVLTHMSPYQMRGEIYIPLLVRLPGRSEAGRIDRFVSQTAIAPTILDICGLERPEWMAARSLLAASPSEGDVAFTQFLVGNDPFGPVRIGTLGAVDGVHQYVFDIVAKRGRLRLWNARGEIDADRSAEAPEAAARLHNALQARFPELFGKA